jgi:hypothetical protein
MELGLVGTSAISAGAAAALLNRFWRMLLPDEAARLVSLIVA